MPLDVTLKQIVGDQKQTPYVAPQIALPTLNKPDPTLQDAMYGAQAYDAFNSAGGFRQGEPETNPFMRPFSHGGAPTMLAGFALGDLFRDMLLRHASAGTKNTVNALQFLSNLSGIGQTNGNLPRRP